MEEIIKALENIPSIKWLDNKQYPAIKKGEILKLPKSISEALIKGKLAEKIEFKELKE